MDNNFDNNGIKNFDNGTNNFNSNINNFDKCGWRGLKGMGSTIEGGLSPVNIKEAGGDQVMTRKDRIREDQVTSANLQLYQKNSYWKL